MRSLEELQRVRKEHACEPPYAKDKHLMGKFFDVELIRLDALGLIPGPDECEVEFWARATRCLESPNSGDSTRHCTALNRVQAEYGVYPRWVKIDFDHAALRWWQIGAWEGGDFPRIVLQNALYRGSYGGYSHQEVLAHELAHAARSAFSHDLFDEFLCYQLSVSGLRRFLGPYCSQPWTPILLLSALAANVIWVVIEVVAPETLFAELAFGVWMIAYGAVGCSLLRFAFCLALFMRAKHLLCKVFGKSRGRWWLFRLSQKEALSVGLLGLNSQGLTCGSGPRRRLLRGVFK